jgi:hypothetical protein
MEFLDPKKQKAHLIRLIIGYVLVSIALILTTIILLYQANGFGIKNGEVIQNGLVFVSSRPNPGTISINGKLQKETTNTRLLMLAGQYTFQINRDGYRPWKRAINVEGGAVVRFDYPLLFPSKLITTNVKTYAAQPPLSSQSPDRRWLLVQSPSTPASFDVFDLKAPKVSAQAVALSASLLKLATGLQRWKVVEWADDNRHVLLTHSSEQDGAAATEYILLDREDPARSVNLTSTLGLANTTAVSLRSKKFDQFYLHDSTSRLLSTASLQNPESKPFLERVLGFKSYGDATVLYATDKAAPAGKATIKIIDNGKSYTLRQVAAGTTYMLDLTRYDNAWYVVTGASSEGRSYVYKNPMDDLQADPRAPLVPVQVLKTPGTQYVAFSENARFIMAQGGQHFAVYDAENDRGYAYVQPAAMDSPQEHATWMDGHRMMLVSGGLVTVFDFDRANQETLVAASPSYVPYFDRDSKFLYTLTPQPIQAAGDALGGGYVLTSTALLKPGD